MLFVVGFSVVFIPPPLIVLTGLLLFVPGDSVAEVTWFLIDWAEAVGCLGLL